MPEFSVNIDQLHLGTITAVSPVAISALRGPDLSDGMLSLETVEGAEFFATFTPEVAALLLMVWNACQYGGEGEDEAETLAELRKVFSDCEARRIARMNEALSMGTAA